MKILYRLLEIIAISAIYYASIFLNVKTGVYVGVWAIAGTPLLWMLFNNPYEILGKKRRKLSIWLWVLSNLVFIDLGGRSLIIDGHIWGNGALVLWGTFLEAAQHFAVTHLQAVIIPFAFSEYTYRVASYMPIQASICWVITLGSEYLLSSIYPDEYEEASFEKRKENI